MRHAVIAGLATVGLALLAVVGSAATPLADGGGGFDFVDTAPHLTAAQRDAIWDELNASRARLYGAGKLGDPEATAVVLLDWPLAASASLTDPGYHGVGNFVDQDPLFPNRLLDYNCGARSYDLASGYNHQGIDIFTWPFAWQRMDADQVIVVAAAAGTILYKHDTTFDRSCGFNSDPWNAVYVEHADGSVAWYGHLKTGSATTRPVGATVAAGDFLGVVGSSGSSTGPHLHLELYGPGDVLQEPYDGPCNGMNPGARWWRDQRPYYDSAVNALLTGAEPPDFSPACPNPALDHRQDVFAAGDVIYFTRFYRDQLAGQTTLVRILRPDASEFARWEQTMTTPAHYSASYWWNSRLIGIAEPAGRWSYAVTYEGVTVSRPFWIGAPIDIRRGVDVPSLMPIARAGLPWDEPEPVLGGGYPSLLMYQVTGAASLIRLTRLGASLAIE